MFFTPAERRLLALLAVLLGLGYASAALCRFGLLPVAWCRGCDADRTLAAAPALDPLATSPDARVGREGRANPRPQFRDGFLDLNHADSASLCALPGIGPTLAGRILTRRRRAPFRELPELLEVKGIGPRKLEQLQPLLIAVQNASAERDSGNSAPPPEAGPRRGP